MKERQRPPSGPPVRRYWGPRGKAWQACPRDQRSRTRRALCRLCSAASWPACRPLVLPWSTPRPDLPRPCLAYCKPGLRRLSRRPRLAALSMPLSWHAFTQACAAGLCGWLRPGAESAPGPAAKVHQARGGQVRAAGARGRLRPRPVRHQRLEIQGRCLTCGTAAWVGLPQELTIGRALAGHRHREHAASVAVPQCSLSGRWGHCSVTSSAGMP